MNAFSLRRGGALASMALLVSMLAAATAAPAVARVDGGCPAGAGWERFQIRDSEGNFPLETYLLAYPTNAAAIKDGIYTAVDLVAQVQGGDRNGNGWVCVKDVYKHNGGNGQGFSYYVSGIDDNAAPRR